MAAAGMRPRMRQEATTAYCPGVFIGF